MPDPLSPLACRVLGCLLEKEVTVPATYPLTLKAVVSACNQTSGRDPIMAAEAHEVDATLDDLRAVGLTRKVHASHGARVVKHRQVAVEELGLDPEERSVLTVLLLRGAQTPGELRSRSERLHEFASGDEVAAVLARLAARSDPLVLVHPRRPGQKEQRWSHLLGGPVDADPGPALDQAAPLAEPLHPNLAPLAPFVGRWVGEGRGEYPTIEPFTYSQEWELKAVAGKPFLAYRSATRSDERPLHAEVGFLRFADGAIELVLAQGSGLVEVAEGLLDGNDLLLESTTVAGAATAKSVQRTERRYRVEADGSLTYNIAMAAVGQPMTHHLTARLTRA